MKLLYARTSPYVRKVLVLAHETGQAEAARTLLASALPRAPRDIGLRFLSGLAAARAGEPEQAKATWQALIEEAPPEAPWRAMVQRSLSNLP